MSERPDTELLDWFEQNCARARSRWNDSTTGVEWDVRGGNWRASFRAAVEAAMDVEERA